MGSQVRQESIDEEPRSPLKGSGARLPLWQEKRERMGTRRVEEGKGRQKMETSSSSRLDTVKNGRQVNIRLLGKFETVNLQGYQSQRRENTDLHGSKVEIFPDGYEGKTLGRAS